MELSELQTRFEQHIVTAGEALLSQLCGVFSPGQQPQWGVLATTPASVPAEEWLVDTLQVLLISSTDYDIWGRRIELIAPNPSGVPVGFLPSHRWNAFGSRTIMDRPSTVRFGVGCLLRTPSTAAGNKVEVYFTYRRVHHDHR